MALYIERRCLRCGLIYDRNRQVSTCPHGRVDGWAHADSPGLKPAGDMKIEGVFIVQPVGDAGES